MSTTAETIRDLVTPVVMISANGLICLALYNRLATMMTCLRSFHKERYDVHTAIAGANEILKADLRSLRLREESLAEQCLAITKRARLVRNALMMMLLGVVGMLMCSLVLGLASFVVGLPLVGLFLFITGILCMIVGTGFALAELASSLETEALENHSVEQLSISTSREGQKQAA